MAWLKLLSVGDKTVGVVRQLGAEKSPRGSMQVHFRMANGDDIYVPDEAAYVQLEQCGFGTAENMEFDDILGHTLMFQRVAAPAGGVPHWKITRVAVLEHGEPTPLPAPVPSPRASVTTVPAARAAVGTLNDHLPSAPGQPTRPAPDAPTVAQLGKAERWTAIVAAYERATAEVIRVQMAAARKHKGSPKPTAVSVQEGVTTLMLRAERLNAI